MITQDLFVKKQSKSWTSYSSPIVSIITILIKVSIQKNNLEGTEVISQKQTRAT